MGITSSNKQIDRQRIGCDGSLQVSLALPPRRISPPIPQISHLPGRGGAVREVRRAGRRSG